MVRLRLVDVGNILFTKLGLQVRVTVWFSAAAILLLHTILLCSRIVQLPSVLPSHPVCTHYVVELCSALYNVYVRLV